MMRNLVILGLAALAMTCKTRRPNFPSSDRLQETADGRTAVESNNLVRSVVRMDIVVPDDGLGLADGAVIKLNDEEKVAAVLGTVVLGAAAGYVYRGPGKAPGLAKQLDGKNSDISSLTRRNSDLVSKSKELQKQLEEAQLEVAAGRAGASELEELRTTKAATDAQLRAVQEELTSARTDKAASEALWKGQLDELGTGNTDLTAELAAAQNKVTELEKQLKESGGKNAEVEKKLGEAQAALAKETAKLGKVQGNLRVVNAQIQGWKDQVARQTEEINRSRSFEDVQRNPHNYIISKTDTHLFAVHKVSREYRVFGPEHTIAGTILDARGIKRWADLPGHLKNVGDGVLFPNGSSFTREVDIGETRYDLLGLVVTKTTDGNLIVIRSSPSPEVGDQLPTLTRSEAAKIGDQAQILAGRAGNDGPLLANYQKLRPDRFEISEPKPFEGQVTFGSTVAIPFGEGADRRYAQAIIWGERTNDAGNPIFYFILNDGGKSRIGEVAQSQIKSLP